MNPPNRTAQGQGSIDASIDRITSALEEVPLQSDYDRARFIAACLQPHIARATGLSSTGQLPLLLVVAPDRFANRHAERLCDLIGVGSAEYMGRIHNLPPGGDPRFIAPAPRFLRVAAFGPRTPTDRLPVCTELEPFLNIVKLEQKPASTFGHYPSLESDFRAIVEDWMSSQEHSGELGKGRPQAGSCRRFWEIAGCIITKYFGAKLGALNLAEYSDQHMQETILVCDTLSSGPTKRRPYRRRKRSSENVKDEIATALKVMGDLHREFDAWVRRLKKLLARLDAASGDNLPPSADEVAR